jgi:hypothetical protein
MGLPMSRQTFCDLHPPARREGKVNETLKIKLIIDLLKLLI